MRWRFRVTSGLLLAVLMGFTVPLAGQAIELTARGPRFLAVPPTGGAPVDASNAAILQRRVSLSLTRVTVEAALEEIGRQARVEVMYSKDILPAGRTVSVEARSFTVAAALTETLLGSGLDVLLLPDGQMALIRKTGEARAKLVQGGTVVGRVADAKSGESLAGAEVLLEGTRWRATSGEDGRYRLAEVAPGSYTFTVRRVGYTKQSRAVAVAEGAEFTVDVALQPVPTQLNEIVTTVTGEQRLRELGHVVGRINADSVVKAAPVASLAELLNGRVPGLQVFTNSGQVGGKVSLQVRTPNSLNLGTEPIVLVDGIRYTSGTGGTGGVRFGAEPTSRLNDLNPNDIESIEVVKGPSAATLYGTDAANGVIVITTKRGRPGPARWNAYARTSRSEIPLPRYPDVYWGWSDEFGAEGSCTLSYVAQGYCLQDSVTVLSKPVNDPQLTIFDSKPRWEYGANVSGGPQQFRYYLSGDLERAIGPIQMPQETIERLKAERGVTELPEEQLEPNAFTKMNLRANVTTTVAKTAELQLSTGYGHHATRTLAVPSGSNLYQSGVVGTPTNPYNSDGLSPEQLLAQTSTERVDRFFGSATGQWRPWAWLQARGTAGLDFTSSNRASLVRPGEAVAIWGRGGFAGDDRARQLAITSDLGLTALVRRGRLSFRTAAGAQYVRSLNNVLGSSGLQLPPGGESVGQAANQFVSQSYSETVTLGSYLEETVGLNDRLFITGALRVDGASAFGRDYEAAAYPKASVSWILSEEPFLPRLPGVEELRLRYAFGASGQQALSHMSLPTFEVQRTILDGATTNRVTLAALGSPTLRPERVREHEFGLDASGWAGRVQLGLTWFHRRTIDQIVFRQLAPGFGFSYTNLGLTTGRGFEAELTARLVETRLLSWQVSLQHALRRTLLVELGDVSPRHRSEGGYVEGYPLGARFAPAIVGYADANGDGLIGPDEVQLGEPVYLGEGTPPRSQTLTTTVGLFQQRLRLSALFERRSGFSQVNRLTWWQCLFGNCREAVDPTTPLAEQAEVAALFSSDVGFTEPGDFTRFRELTAALDLPAGLLRPVRLRSASLSVAVRNLALWTSFDGPDPESAAVSGIAGGAAEGIPQGRSWVFRLDLGL